MIGFKLNRKIKLPLIIGFAGVVVCLALTGSYTAFTSVTDRTGFCITCHEMEATVYREYLESSHYKNTTGIKAACADCHLPKTPIARISRELRAVNEITHKIKGSIATREKFEEKRLVLAKRVWAEMEKNDSHTCRSCHDFGIINFTKFAKKEDAKRMQEGVKKGDACISCHKGIAHKMPDMASGYKALYQEIEAIAQIENAKADRLYSIKIKGIYPDKDLIGSSKPKGKLLPATEIKVLERDGDYLKVSVSGWQQDGVVPLIYALKGRRIFSVVLGKALQTRINKTNTIVDPHTELIWHEVNVAFWMTKDNLVQDTAKLLEYGAELHGSSCSSCHAATPAHHFTANQWIGNLKSMKRNLALNKEEYRVLLNYLQMHASDVSDAKH